MIDKFRAVFSLTVIHPGNPSEDIQKIELVRIAGDLDEVERDLIRRVREVFTHIRDQ